MPVLKIQSVTLERSGRTLLQDINWRIEAGESWVVMGLNGSGKTSLMTLITGYQWPTAGTIEVLGARYGSVDLREHRKRIGWVSHHLSEWMSRDHGHLAVRDLVASGPDAIIGSPPSPRAHSAPLTSCLHQFGLLERAETRFGLLSQGEKTRVLLARAYLSQAELILMDEPCSGLDIRGREELLTLIGEQLGRTPVIYVTHHVEEVVPGFTHVLLLQAGQILAAGPKGDVLTSENLSATFQVPISVDIVHGRPWARVQSERLGAGRL